MSFLEKEDEKKSPFWDWFIGIGLLVLVGGFILYYQMQKRATQRQFAAADELYRAGDLTAAAAAYEALKDASYLTAANDSTIYARLDLIEAAEEGERESVARLRTRLTAGDTTGVRGELDTLVFRGLLDARDQFWIDSVKAAFDRNDG
ncbi:MAG TPA: hypothetical protein VKZ88_02375 [Fibrobacteria bacterium]|nr:hypothetical protein [Fibrobacteria bacterium]